ncbi:MAG: RDD family protein [Candidatus Nanoarchaeia archaeon]|nr:RDD family protein [Candidatus Nanoarchaeia archaeon]
MRLKKSELNKLLGKNDVAPFWKRVIAYIIDILIINSIVVLPFRDSLNEIYKGEMLFKVSFNDIKSVLLMSMIIAILSLIYWVVLEYRIQQTIGKHIMNIYVISMTKKINFSQIIIRNVTKISLPLLILDILYMLNNKSQRYTEKLSNTKVIEE